MSRHKKMYLVLDTETANTVTEPLPYDIGYVICDRQGNIYEKRSYVVAEIFCDMSDVMCSTYYAKKIPAYWESIRKGERQIKSYIFIRREMLALMKKYHCNTVCAYNMDFDRKALNNLVRYCSKSFFRYFFPFNTKFTCIWNMACQVIMQQVKYVEFCLKNGYTSEKGNVLTNAEKCFAFLTKDVDFSESHTALEDVMIEVEIMTNCFKKHKKMSQEVNRFCWRIPQVTKKKILSKKRK